MPLKLPRKTYWGDSAVLRLSPMDDSDSQWCKKRNGRRENILKKSWYTKEDWQLSYVIGAGPYLPNDWQPIVSDTCRYLLFNNNKYASLLIRICSYPPASCQAS